MSFPVAQSPTSVPSTAGSGRVPAECHQLGYSLPASGRNLYVYSMNISATIKNTGSVHEVSVSTAGNAKSLSIPAKPTGGSAANGGELLFLALATCFCNDLYREAARRSMRLDSVEVVVSGEFGREGEPGFNIQYQAQVESPGSTPQQIKDLIRDVDRVAEVHNTLRKGVSVTLKGND